MSDRTEITLFSSPEHDCGYLDDRQARNLIIDPTLKLDAALYEQLLARGFRRSGGHVYRPSCDHCDACIPMRIPVDRFRPNRSQRRALRANRDLSIQSIPAGYRDEHYALYRKYTAARHPDGDMATADPEQYREFLIASWSHTLFLELRVEETLLAVAVTDVMPRSLSAVYTFFDTDAAQLSPGVISLLVQVQLAQRLRLDWLYLGYWIGECPKMAYKSRFRPHEIYIDGDWREVA